MGIFESIALIGSLGRGQPCFDGQTLRTKLVLAELNKRAVAPVTAVDTAWLARRPFGVLLAIHRAFRHSSIVLIMPGERGLRVLLPIYQMLAAVYGCTVHYLVVGGWLPDFLNGRRSFLNRLRRVDGIYVQSQRMLTQLQAFGLSNAHYLPNFKDFRARRNPSVREKEVLSLVFLSRIIPEKGVEHCFEALRLLNTDTDKLRVCLDVWGTTPEEHTAWLDDLLQQHVPGVRHRGPLEPESVVDQLCNYDAMLFPTWYRGEGFPGVIVDAYAAGIPVIASDWHDNAEFVKHLKTGLVFEAKSVEQLVASINILLDQPELLDQMKAAAAKAVEVYHVDVVIPPLFRQIGIAQNRG